MNKIEAIRGFISFLLILIVFVSALFTVRYLMSKRTPKEDTKAGSEPVMLVPSDQDTGGSSGSGDMFTIDGYYDSLENYNSMYDLNNDGVINSYDYYLLQSLVY